MHQQICPDAKPSKEQLIYNCRTLMKLKWMYDYLENILKAWEIFFLVTTIISAVCVFTVGCILADDQTNQKLTASMNFTYRIITYIRIGSELLLFLGVSCGCMLIISEMGGIVKNLKCWTG